MILLYFENFGYLGREWETQSRGHKFSQICFMRRNRGQIKRVWFPEKFIPNDIKGSIIYFMGDRVKTQWKFEKFLNDPKHWEFSFPKLIMRNPGIFSRISKSFPKQTLRIWAGFPGKPVSRNMPSYRYAKTWGQLPSPFNMTWWMRYGSLYCILKLKLK